MRRTSSGMVAVAAMCVLLSATGARAQHVDVDEAVVAEADADAGMSGEPVVEARVAEIRPSIRRSIATLAESSAFRLERHQARAVGASPGSRPRSGWRTFAGGAVGAVGGFFAGGYLGAAIEGDRCDCDDPGFMGFLIGAPIGVVAGGIAGALFLF